jgi:predicted RNA-binding Zn ribbon-like protein
MTVQSDTPADAAPSFGDPLSIEFANTSYAVRGRPQEGLETPRQLAAWLHGHPAFGLDEAPAVAASDLAAFVELRGTIRDLIQAVVDDEPLDPAAVRSLNDAAAVAPSWPVLALDDTRHGAAVVEQSTGTPADTALGAIARDAVEVLGGALHEKVRACQAPGCVMFFVQNHPRRQWCCAACGNRARVARHYQRHKNETQHEHDEP